MKKGCVVVTGASRGIGAAIACALAARGYSVGCLSRSGGSPQGVELPSGVRARLHSVVCDVGDMRQFESALEEAIKASGEPLVGLVNNAGIHKAGPSDKFPVDDFRQILEIDTVAVFAASQAAYPKLLASGGGLIVNIGSFYDKLGVKGNAAYCAAKAAVGAITRCLAVEWGHKGIRMIDVAPGYIATDLNKDAIESGPLAAYLAKRIPGGKPAQAREVGELVASLYAMEMPFLTGETLYFDGGQGVSL